MDTFSDIIDETSNKLLKSDILQNFETPDSITH